MATVAKLTQQGELKLSGNIDTRLPLVTDGLVAHMPMDGTVKGIANFNILDYSTWVIGTSGTQAGFSANGTTAENSIVEDVGPFGESQAIWQALGNDAASDADGGWNGSTFSIDRTKTYRYSTWIRRKVAGNGTGYFGCQGTQTYNLTANTVNTNPYFWAAGITGDEWRLYVAYIFPSNIGNVMPTHDGGIYDTNGTKREGTTAFKFSPTATTNNHRTYLYYSTLAATNQQWAYPRVDIVDGTEPSLEDLLSGEGNVTNPSNNIATTITNDYVAIEEATTNYASSGTNGYAAPDISHWNEGNGKYYSTHEGNKQTIVWPTASGSPYIYTHDYVFADDLTTLSGKVITASLMLRRVEGSATGRIRFYDNISGYRYQDVSVTKEFKRFTITATVGSSPTRIFFMIDNTGGGTYEFYNVQLEQKSFATEYVDGSRSSSGKLTIPNPVKHGEFTVSYDWKSNSPVGTPSSYQTSFSMGSYYTNNSFTIMDTNSASTGGAQRLIRKGNAGEWAWIEVNLTETASFQDWTTITIVRNATYYRVYSNGIYKGQLAHSSTTMQDYIHVGSRESWRTGENSSTRNLSIYNRALSDSEVTKLANGTHSFTQDGLITKSINTTGEIRYIRDYLNGSTANTGNHWVEIKANTQDGTNVALGKVPTSNVTLTNGAYLTNGVISSAYVNGSAGLAYVQIDLGSMQLIDNIQVWHYYPDGRTYYGTRTQVSHDGIKWYDVFNSATQGTYAETINGVTHYVGGSGATAMKASATGLATNGINTNVTLV